MLGNLLSYKESSYTGEEMNIFDIFTKASVNLKYPQISYPHNNIMLVFKLAGAKSSVPGSITITDDSPYPSKFFGRIVRDEEARKFRFQWNDRLPFLNQELKDIIQTIVTNPIEMCAVKGQKTVHCCFCQIELTSKASLAVGYGPICAEKWGLPWGDTTNSKDVENL